MANTTTRLIRLAMTGALACLPMLIERADAQPARPMLSPHKHRFHHRWDGERAPRSKNTAGGHAIPGGSHRTPVQARDGGDTSGFPGDNEFDPSAPFGGQAAVTAPVGSDAFKEQMIQRRDFCEYASNRC